jgi:dihydrofolate reductase
VSAAAPNVALVAAVAANGVIGRGGALPWHLPDDLRQFRQLTMGGTLIMGRRTFESIGRPLPGRTSVVVSTTLTAPPAEHVELARSLDEALALAAQRARPAFIIGGAALYRAAIPIVGIMHLTQLDEAVDGDVLFPPIDWREWRLTSNVHHERDEHHAMGFCFCVYARQAARP